MASGVEKDDIEFRATISTDLLNATFEEHSPAFNVEKALESVLEKHVASQDDSLQSYSHRRAAQVIRVILKDWRAFKVNLGEQFEPGHPLDTLDFGYTAMQAIKDDFYNHESLPYKVMHCFTAEMREYNSRGDFTQEKLQGIIDGASKAYLNIMAVAFAMAGDDGVPDLDPDPKQSTATYTAVTINSPDAQGTKRKAQSPSSDDDQKEGESARKPAKRTTKSTFKGDDDQKGMNGSPKPPKKSQKLRMEAAVGEARGFEIIDETLSLDPDGRAGRGSDGRIARGQGNFNHGHSIKWIHEEDEWARDQLRVNPGLVFKELTTIHNEHWEGTTFDDGKNGTVERGKRTQEAIQRRFVKFRQGLREAKKDGLATQGVSDGVKRSGSFSAANIGSSVPGATARPYSDIRWMGGIIVA
jgi:hypothetical protein